MYVTIVSMINFYIVVLSTAAVRGCPGRYDFHMIKVTIREKTQYLLTTGLHELGLPFVFDTQN
jgi:uncharacterized membrane protein